MDSNKIIKGFSKLSKKQKIEWIADNFFDDTKSVIEELQDYWIDNKPQQKVLDGFSENTISNYPMPYGVAPNFIIDDKVYCVPMVIEESSVVAAASAGAKFWMRRGGFRTKILGTKKMGHVHFLWAGDPTKLKKLFPKLKNKIYSNTESITANMRARGGGIIDIELIDMNHKKDDYYQIKGTFETCDSMGANFINSNLETIASTLEEFLLDQEGLDDHERDVQVIMSILSNYTPDCVIRSSVSCPVDDLGSFPDGMTAEDFAQKFYDAVEIAHLDIYRATTHNKGIFNGVDAVVLATGNDFRAIEACGHTYAARNGQYESLSYCEIKDGMFKFWIDLPLAVGTVGGLTSLHPLAKRSLELMGNPSATELMSIIASVGLAQNFAALRSLVTTGIQKGHMKMHLLNILIHLEATDAETKMAVDYFSDKIVSFSSARAYLATLRNQ